MDGTLEVILALFSPGTSLSFGEVCEAMGMGDWTETWVDVCDKGLVGEVVGGDDSYYYRCGDEVAEVEALRRSLADVASDVRHLKFHLEQLISMNIKHREPLREQQRSLTLLLEEVRRLVP